MTDSERNLWRLAQRAVLVTAAAFVVLGVLGLGIAIGVMVGGAQ